MNREKRRFSIDAARRQFAELVNRAGYGKERILICRYDRAVAAIVSVADLQRLEHEDRQKLETTSTHAQTTTKPLTGPEYGKLLAESMERELRSLGCNVPDGL
jgi:prevent-host-death family protein